MALIGLKILDFIKLLLLSSLLGWFKPLVPAPDQSTGLSGWDKYLKSQPRLTTNKLLHKESQRMVEAWCRMMQHKYNALHMLPDEDIDLHNAKV